MSNNLILTVPVSSGAADKPFYHDSARLIFGTSAFANGALALIDLASPLRSVSTLPGNNTAIPNHAWKEFAALTDFDGTDAEKQANADAIFTDLHQAADAMFELTGKGGLHGIYSQTNNSNAQRGAYVGFPTALKTYLLNNKTNHYYFSMWTRRTRVAITSGATPRLSALHTDSTSNYAEFMDAAGNTGHGQTGSVASNGANSLGNSRRSVDFTGFVTPGSVTSASDIITLMMMWGNPLTAYNAFENRAASDVLYSFYLEDLTVSGRSFSDADAWDARFFAKAFATGGRYDADTFTDPATFA